jgi:hypothetical protein
MIKQNKRNIFKLMVLLTVLHVNLFSCSAPVVKAPTIDANVDINAKKSYTSFSVTWKFNKEFITTLASYDKNKNGKFDKDEQKEIENHFADYVKQNSYLTDVIYVKKGLKNKKNEIRKLNIIDSGLLFCDGEIKYCFNFDVDFILKEDYRLYIRFFDFKSNVTFNFKDIIVNNYGGIKVIQPQNTSANIHFYKYLPNSNILKDNHSYTLKADEHKHDHDAKEHKVDKL